MKIEWKKEWEYEGMNETKVTKDGAIKRGGTWRVCVAGQDTAWGEHQNDAERVLLIDVELARVDALFSPVKLSCKGEKQMWKRGQEEDSRSSKEKTHDSESGRYAQIAFGGGRRHAGG